MDSFHPSMCTAAVRPLGHGWQMAEFAHGTEDLPAGHGSHPTASPGAAFNSPSFTRSTKRYEKSTSHGLRHVYTTHKVLRSQGFEQKVMPCNASIILTNCRKNTSRNQKTFVPAAFFSGFPAQVLVGNDSPSTAPFHPPNHSLCCNASKLGNFGFFLQVGSR